MFKQVIIVRKDLKLGKGKLAAQVAHAAILAAEKSKFKNAWQEEGQKKVVVWCKNLEELLSLYKKARAQHLPVILVKDAGLTQVKKGTKTCVAIGPAPTREVDKISGGLKLV